MLAQFRAAAEQAAGGPRAAAEAEQTATQVARLGREERRLIDAYQAEVITLDELRERRERLQAQREALAREQARRERQRQASTRAREVLTDLTAFCARVSQRLDAATFAERQAILQLLVEKIVVGEETLEIRHVLPLRGAPQHPGGPSPPDSGLRLHGMLQ